MDKLKKDINAVSKILSKLTQKIEKIQKDVDKQVRFSKKAKAKSAKKKAVKKVPAKKPVVRKTAPPTAVNTIHTIIRKSKKGVTTSELMKRTGYERKAISNAIYILTKQGKIKTVAKGIYVTI